MVRKKTGGMLRTMAGALLLRGLCVLLVLASFFLLVLLASFILILIRHALALTVFLLRIVHACMRGSGESV